MNRSGRAISTDAYLASLLDRTAGGVATIAVDGGEIPLLTQLQDSSTVVFSFSGAVDRARHSLPFFTSTSLHKHAPASIIGVSDPSLVRGEELKLSWYAGDDRFAVQLALTELVHRIVDALDATRVVFLGGSGGGFAALYYAWRLPGSVALVSNPQTNLNHAIRLHRDRYRAACWPSLPEQTSLAQTIDVDLGALYASRCDTSVIYLQEASDFYHVKWHFGPFVSKLPREYSDRLVIRMAHWGRRGHQAVPAYVWIPWLLAALTAPNTYAAAIEETWSEQNAASPIEEPRVPKPKLVTRAANRDEQIAARLARSAARVLQKPPSSERLPS